MPVLDKETNGGRAVRSLALAAAAMLAGACAGGASSGREARPSSPGAGAGTAGAATAGPATARPATDATDTASARPAGVPGESPRVTVRVLRKAPPMSDALAAEIGCRPVAEIVPYLMSADADERRIAVRALGRAGGDDAAQEAATLLRDPDPAVREEACFAVGVTGSPLAAALLGPILEGKPSHAEVAAAAQGLAMCKDDAAGALLVRLCLRDDLPTVAPEALFRYARWRGRPWDGGLPDDGLLRWEKAPTPRGRAAIGWFGRTWKDPKLLPALLRLSQDPSPDVQRAAAFGLAEGKDATKRSDADAAMAVAALTQLSRSFNISVAVAATRVLASYEREDALSVLRERLQHSNFHVRTTAAEGSGTRKAAAAFDGLREHTVHGVFMVNTYFPDPKGPAGPIEYSSGVRYAAAKACLAIDPKRSQGLVDNLLADESNYVRSAAAEILAKSEDAGAADRLAALATSDPHVLVREQALDGLKEKDSPAARAAVTAALSGSDPVLASIAADVAATNGWKDLAPAMRAAFARHTGTPGADAREGIVAALAKLGDPADDALISRTAADDPDAGPRVAAQAAFAEKAGVPPPPFDRRPRPEGATLPLGAKLLDRDADLIVETSEGTMVIQLDASEAPIHAAHLADLARKGFYDGLTWHRVVADFVIQGGCPRGDGAGNAGVTLPLEPTRTPFVRGTLGMPRSNHPDTGGCQLFICHSRAPHLDVQYAAIGQVVSGLDVIDRIDVGSEIVRVRVADRAPDGK